MSNTRYNIHPDFSKLPVITLGFGPLLLWLLNTLMRLQCFFVKRKLQVELNAHPVQSGDGHRFTVFAMVPPGLTQPAPALVYYHGGGFAMTYGGLHLKNCERYAIEAQCIVIFVDYRLAPRQPFPDGFNDCHAALQWTLQQAGALGIDAQRVAVGGDSAGGALAAGVAQRARDENLGNLCAQFLIYPVLDNRCDSDSATEFIDVPVWNALSNRAMWRMYLSRYPQAEPPPPYAAPGRGALHDLPLSYIETAEFDPLRDEGLQLATALEQQGIPVVRNATLQTVHGFDAMAKSQLTAQAMDRRIAFLAEAFHGQAAVA
ncbi:MAG: alpha/beta hydrolase [Halioglobus sp.]|nr:alpha/beta hydrolase [Halioglobus sp.]